MRVVGTILVMVVVATAVAAFAGRRRIPAPPLLVIAGLTIALIPGVPALRVPPDAIALVVLPPLLYASAGELSPRDLRKLWRPVAILAFGLVLASAAAVGAAAVAFTPLPAGMAFVLGAILASTDPVAVTALGRRLPLPGRVQALVQAESLFNDATSLVLFKVALGVAVASGGVCWSAAASRLALLAGGGTVLGAVAAGLVTLILRRTTDPVLNAVIALVTPYAVYVLGEWAHTSGVTAVVVAGVLLGRSGRRLAGARGPARLQVRAVYAVTVFLLESVVFGVIGFELPVLVRDLPRGTGWWPLQALVLALVLLAVRALWTRPLSAAVGPAGAGRAWRTTAVMTWAGTRGVMPLAAALSIPSTSAGGGAVPGRELVLVLTTAVVVLTLVVQGLTLGGVVDRSGLALEPGHAALEEARVREALAAVALVSPDRSAGPETLPEPETLPDAAPLSAYTCRVAHLGRDDDRGGGGTVTRSSDVLRHDTRRVIIARKNAELRRLYDDHLVGEATRRRLQMELDREESALGDG